MKAALNSDRSVLTITVDEEEQKQLREDRENEENFCSDSYMHDFFERFIANSEYEWVTSEMTGDLTNAPMLGIYGENEEVTERWGFMAYQIISLQETLAEKGSAILIS